MTPEQRYASAIKAGLMNESERALLMAGRVFRDCSIRVHARLSSLAALGETSKDMATAAHSLTDTDPPETPIEMPEGFVDGRVLVELHHTNSAVIQVGTYDPRAWPILARALRASGRYVVEVKR